MSRKGLFRWPRRPRTRFEARDDRRECQRVQRSKSDETSEQSAVEWSPSFQTFLSQPPPTFDVPLRVFVGVRVFGASLDDKLAAGRGPETSELLAARAQLIVSTPRRRKLAESWMALLDDARDTSGRPTTGIPFLRDRVNEAQGQIQALVNALLAPLPTSRGVAMANALLCDGTGPIYHRACPADLVSTLREIIKRLDPITG